ncbi:alpha/beta hydrolase [Rheinheimera sp. 1928-s]|uniref:alpha/beta hydrolase family protein n=1 Tax=Rheinheimera sp. 1928-s TaxID=3033803 RepID=UPI00260DA2EA|nr:alpha/beta hydrolase [Rheinheimera sp. 1928-s]MDF3126537.1 alpha/beta hydrolase [Rheinheimera sp. 1928-s]
MELIDTRGEKIVRNMIIAFIVIVLSACTIEQEQEKTTPEVRFTPGTTMDFTFDSNGLTLSGIFDTPAKKVSEALIIFVHGYGGSDIRGRNSYADLRQRFNEIGIATAVWDKPGQGQSEGAFDINQSVFSSAEEVLDAASYLRQINAPGSDRIGIWGISRAGWIAPIALSQDSNINFWISVSGTTAEDNFSYLLLSNLPHEGDTVEQAEKLAEEWRAGCNIFRTGGSYDLYQSATQQLRANEYIKQMRGKWQSRAQYEAQQLGCNAGTCANIDDDMCSYVFIKNFEAMLSSLEVDTLAIFGERDLNVDWRKTSKLYQTTIGQNPKASLLIASFEDADHNLHVSETGSIREMQNMNSPLKSDGYYDVQLKWLLETVLESRSSN